MVVQEVLSGGDLTSLIPTLAMFGVASMKLIPSINSISSGIIQLRFNQNTISLLHADMQKYKEIQETTDIQQIKFHELTLKNVN